MSADMTIDILIAHGLHVGLKGHFKNECIQVCRVSRGCSATIKKVRENTEDAAPLPTQRPMPAPTGGAPVLFRRFEVNK